MQLVEVLKLLNSIRKLSKINENWNEVKHIYMVCIKLIVSITIVRYLTEGLMCFFFIAMALNLVNHPLVLSYFTQLGIHEFTESILKI